MHCESEESGYGAPRRETMSSFRILLALCMITSGFVSGAAAHDRESCSNASLRGSFGFRATGNTTTGGALIVMGRFEFDGDGNLTAKLFTRTPTGTNVADTYTGQYSVDSQCVVTDFWRSDSTGVVTTHVSVIVNNGKGYYVLNTTDGAPTIISGEAKRQ
jgi:hypothetical protein